jgi:malonate-semialdehyde dehydrogenase (acetylating) / methylmalonate-semialdehyde dehydrogenase
MSNIGHWINGQTVAGEGRLQDVYNPADGTVSAQVRLASRPTVEMAIARAETAFPGWRNTPPARRAQVLFRLKRLLEDNSDAICALITQEHGKVLNDAAGELQRGIEVIDYMCGVPELLKGEHTKNVGPAIDSWSERQALGVVAGITPFNFPAMVPLWILVPAIACGNTIVLKPSERAPSAMQLVAALAKEAGLPDGVLNVVNGDKEAVDTLLEDKRIEAVAFVGSTPVAEYIYAKGCANGKRVKALGGAKNHAIVMPDADLDNAVSALMGAAYGSCGERCMAISVVVAVGDALANDLVAKLKQRIEVLKVGAGTDNSNDMGPLITAQHREKVIGYIDSAERQGARIVADGRTLSVQGLEKGYFIGPTLIDHVKPEMTAYKEEIFGPVLCVVRCDSLQHAMNLIDAHEFGNGTCLFTRDGGSARYFTDNIKVGMVGVNVPLPVPVAYHSFCGWKRSAFGDNGMYGPDSVNFFTRRKTITQRWPAREVRENAHFSFPSNS